MDSGLMSGLGVAKHLCCIWLSEILECLINPEPIVADPCSDSEFRHCRRVLEVMSQNVHVDGSVCAKTFAVCFRCFVGPAKWSAAAFLTITMGLQLLAMVIPSKALLAGAFNASVGPWARDQQRKAPNPQLNAVTASPFVSFGQVLAIWNFVLNHARQIWLLPFV